MNRTLLALASIGFAVMLALPAHAKSEPARKSAGIEQDARQPTEFSAQRRYYRRAYWGPRRAYWGPRRAYWGPRRAYWGPRYWGPRRAYWGPRRAYWGPRYYWRPRPVYWGPRYYWGGPAISVGFGFGPRWWW